MGKHYIVDEKSQCHEAEYAIKKGINVTLSAQNLMDWIVGLVKQEEEHEMIHGNFMKLQVHICMREIKGFQLSLNIHILANPIAGVNTHDLHHGVLYRALSMTVQICVFTIHYENILYKQQLMLVDGNLIVLEYYLFVVLYIKKQITFHQLLVKMDLIIGEFKHHLEYLGENLELLDQHQEILVVYNCFFVRLWHKINFPIFTCIIKIANYMFLKRNFYFFIKYHNHQINSKTIFKKKKKFCFIYNSILFKFQFQNQKQFNFYNYQGDHYNNSTQKIINQNFIDYQKDQFKVFYILFQLSLPKIFFFYLSLFQFQSNYFLFQITYFYQLFLLQSLSHHKKLS
ncbi:unnamed protein product [Paramecium primaurelia]|uniref:Transmembrane protein n=1 Tax=Paramecium primaurelia TaxID=5886 RepID=A0A8S1QWR4_PARPR|nr:unnamed protein product [Paramecium primaurelia]CAD8118637.1 unnamed protein product [Paramecium primaurelia]CAD8119853.1 unnamed protein product [Paramecium primaurelia]